MNLQFIWDTALSASGAAAILFVVTMLVQLAIGRRLRAAWRFALWLPLLLRLLVPALPESSWSMFNAPRWLDLRPATTSVGLESKPASALSPMPRAAIIVDDTALPDGADSFAAEASGSLPTDDRGRISLAHLWLIGVAMMLARLIVGWIWLRLKLRGAAPCSDIAVPLEKAAAALKVRMPRVLTTDLVESPALFGVVRPVLLVPPGLHTQLAEHELRHVLLHEVAHIKRRDLFFNCLMEIAQAIHWFNPLIWFALRSMRLEREIACDELALRGASREESRAYGETILRLLQGLDGRPALPALVGIAEERAHARRRLAAIASGSRTRIGWPGCVALVILVLTGLSNAKTPSGEFKPARVQASHGYGSTESKTNLLLSQAAPDARADAAQNARETVSRTVSTPQAPNPFARTNTIHPNKGRQAILGKLEKIVIDELFTDGPVPLVELLKELSAEVGRLDPGRRGVNFILSVDSADASKFDNYMVTINPPLRNVRVVDVLNFIVRTAKPPEGQNKNVGLAYSIEDYGVVFFERKAQDEPLHTRRFKVNPRIFLSSVENAVGLPELSLSANDP